MLFYNHQFDWSVIFWLIINSEANDKIKIRLIQFKENFE